MFRILAACLVIVVVLGGLELALRLAGTGWPTAFLLRTEVGGKAVWIENPRFTWRFLTPELARSPQPLVVPVAKDPNTLRVVVLGESAAMGDPEPSVGYPRVLQALLEARLPSRRVEVVNTAVTAINSHAIREIARDCESLGADVWIVYMGNNEVMGPFGPGTVFGGKSPNPAVLRAGLWFKTTRTGQWLDVLARRAHLGPPVPNQWGGLEMFLQQQIAADDRRMGDTYSYFQRNLDAILASGRRAGARVVVSTVAVNLRDNAPFASTHASTMKPADLGKWEHLELAGRRASEAGNPREAIIAWAKASELDGGHAELAWRLGRALLSQGNTNAAAKILGIARDADTLRFRADSRINEILRETARNRTNEAIWLVDGERTFALNSRDGIPGDEFFWDHVHFRMPGAYLLAVATGSALMDALPESAKTGARPEWITLNDVASRLAVTQWGDHRVVENVRSRMRRPPFNTQLNAADRDQRLQRESASLAPGLSPTAFNAQANALRKAIERAPDDWVFHDQFGKLSESFGDAEGAVREWRRVIELVPHHVMARLQIGHMLATKDATAADAVPYLMEVLALRPETAEALASLGQSYARQKRFPEAYPRFAEAARLRSDLLETEVQWGIALEADKQTNEAGRHLNQALTISSNSALARVHLARMSASAGDTNAALAHYREVLRIAPAYREARQFLEDNNSPSAPVP